MDNLNAQSINEPLVISNKSIKLTKISSTSFWTGYAITSLIQNKKYRFTLNVLSSASAQVQLKLQKNNGQTNISTNSVNIPISDSIQIVTLDTSFVTADTERLMIQFNLTGDIGEYILMDNPQMKVL